MRALFLTSGADDPSTRYRVRPVADAWRAEGGDAVELPMPPAGRERRLMFKDASSFDVVMLQRRLIAPLDALRLAAQCRRLVFDFDDALPFRDDGRASRVRTLKFRALVRSADCVLAGNANLAALARRFRARTVRVVPTTVPVPVEPEPIRSDGGPLRLGWIGSRSTLRYLKTLERPLAALARRRTGWTLRVVCDDFPDFEGVPVEKVPWSEATENGAIAGFDIGLAPLTDDPWARGKCGLKILQCFAAGRPVVASPVGVQSTLIGANERGRLASSPQQWIESLETLLDDSSERVISGRAAHAFVATQLDRGRWSLEAARAMGALSPSLA
ncbi:MAG: glycosyltransferase [Planctomycetota bacterium]